MRLIKWTWRAAIGALMLTIMLGTGLAAPSSMRVTQNPAYSGRWETRRVSRWAFLLGYNRGYEDAAQPSYRTYRDVERWREGAEGWQQDTMGNRTFFRDNFRRGFAQGFMDGRYHRARRYTQADLDRLSASFNGGGPGDRYGSNRIADQNGYRDGQRRGLFDAHRGHRIDLDSISQFRIGMTGYRAQYGDRDSYRQAYRDGFRRGYEEAFNGR